MDDSRTADSRPPRSQTLVRGLEVIEAVAHAPRAVAEIAAATGMTYSTTHRIASVLVEQRYLKLVNGREYALGPKLIELGFSAHQQTDLVHVAWPHLKALGQETGDTVHLGRREGQEVTYLDKLHGTRPVEINSRIGGRRPLVTTGIGKALLLDATAEELAAIFETGRGQFPRPVSMQDWMAQMGRYAEGGFALDIGDDSPTIRCIAAPVRDAGGRVVAAVSVSSTVDYMPDSRITAMIPVVQETARRIGHDLGAPAR